MDDVRRKILTITKEELSKKPFVEGSRQTIIGHMYNMFHGCKEEEVVSGLEQLGKDLGEFGLILCSYPGHPEILCAMETEDVRYHETI